MRPQAAPAAALLFVFLLSYTIFSDSADADVVRNNTSGGGDVVVADVCARKIVTYPQMCEQVAKANPAAVKKGTYGVLMAHIHTIKAKTIAAIAEAKKIAADSRTDKYTKDALHVCEENFRHAMSDLKALVMAVSARDYTMALMESSGVNTNLVTCGDQFGDPILSPKPIPSPISAATDELQELGSNIVDLTGNLAESHKTN